MKHLLITTLTAATLFTACADDKKPGKGSLNERDRSALVQRPIDDAPGMSLIFTRTRDDGWRSVDLAIGSKRYAFHDNPALYMLDANGQGFGDRTVICGMATPDPQEGTSMSVICAVADPSGLGPRTVIDSPTSAWLGDVCASGDQVTLLYTVGARPIDPEAPDDAPPCMALDWTAAGGWSTTPVPSAACSCEMRDGGACTDPCFRGTGVRRDGACDTAGLTPACDDGDPLTDDFCTGDVNDLCYSVATTAAPE